MRQWFVALCLLFALSTPTGADATAPIDTQDSSQVTTTTAIDNEFLNTDRDIGECIGNSSPLPGCGREPTQPGDRGGWLQYLTMAVMAAGLGFIFWRVARSVKARDAALRSQ